MVDLHHRHLPRLVETDWIEYDRDGELSDRRVTIARANAVTSALGAAADELETVRIAVAADST